MLTVRYDVSLAGLNTMRVGRYARRLVEWETLEDLNSLLNDEEWLSLRRFGFKPIGEGSNLLFLNQDCDLTLLRCKSDKYTVNDSSASEVIVNADAGIKLDALVERTCDIGLWGLENLSMIPGTVGAAAVQNVGAYGVEFKDVVRAVHCYDMDNGELQRFEADKLEYGYRNSMFKNGENRGRYIVVSVELLLQRTPYPKLSYGNLREKIEVGCNDPVVIRRAIIEMRRGKLPEVSDVGSAGSFFKNPVVDEKIISGVKASALRMGLDPETMPVYATGDGYKLSAAWLIDKAGGKDIRTEHVGVWPTQPLVIVNYDGKATGREVAEFAEIISSLVEVCFGVKLHPEVEYL